MRRIQLVIAALLLCLPVLASAQEEWMEFISTEDRFSIPFPGKPTVMEITWPSEYGAVFPGRVYTVQQGASKYSVTVIDYTNAETIHAKLPKAPSFDDPRYFADRHPGVHSIRGDQTVPEQGGLEGDYDAWHYINLISGHQLQLHNADNTKTYVAIYLHENRLYIVDATVPGNSPAQGIFQQNLEMLGADGRNVRYNEIYSNRLPPITIRRAQPGAAGGNAPCRDGRGGRGGGGPRQMGHRRSDPVAFRPRRAVRYRRRAWRWAESLRPTPPIRRPGPAEW